MTFDGRRTENHLRSGRENEEAALEGGFFWILDVELSAIFLFLTLCV